jgi:hypothetical protein
MPRGREYTRRFSVRASEQELAQLRVRARRAGLSLSRYLVESGLALADAPTPEERRQRERALFHVRRVGLNLNQIARRLNSPLPVAEEELAETLAAVRAAVSDLAGGRGAG